jgi:hypothetical protein
MEDPMATKLTPQERRCLTILRGEGPLSSHGVLVAADYNHEVSGSLDDLYNRDLATIDEDPDHVGSYIWSITETGRFALDPELLT